MAARTGGAGGSAPVAGEPLRAQVQWYATLRWAALVAIGGGLVCCLLALADQHLRQEWAAVVVMLSVAILGGRKIVTGPLSLTTAIVVDGWS